MAWVLDRLTTPKAPIDMVRKHRAEEFHGTSLEIFDKAKYWLEKLQRVLDEVKCPPEQMVILQGQPTTSGNCCKTPAASRLDYLGFLRQGISYEIYHRCLQRSQVEAIYESEIVEHDSSRA